MQWSNRDEGVLIGIRSSRRDAGGPMGTQGSQWGRRGSGGNAGVLRDAGCPTAMREGRGVVPMGTWVHSQGCGGSLRTESPPNPSPSPSPDACGLSDPAHVEVLQEKAQVALT